MEACGTDLPPGLTGDALADVADATLGAEDLSAALSLYDRAEPDVRDADRCAGGRWMAHMLRGDFGSAWKESDSIRRRGRPDPHRFWNGEDFTGKRLMLRSLHGFGDAVQMFRFLPKLRDRAAKLIVEVPPWLLEVAPCFAGMGDVITWGEQAPATPPAWDVQMEVMELPHVLRVTADDLLPTHGYLHVPEATLAVVARVVGARTRPRVGLVWGSGHWNTSRSVPFEIMRTLLDVQGVEFWSLQGGDTEKRAWDALEPAPCRRSVYEAGDGILRLAAVVQQMDLVITVDTLAAHLAGALGVPCWVLLQQRADWRWMCGRADSPWYPSLRLWRQREGSGWDELVERVRRELTMWA